MSTRAAQDRAERASFRAFVRAHHPDRGGDPEVFATGLAAYRARRYGDERPRDRYDAPVLVEHRPRGLRAVLRLLRLWRARRLRRARLR